MTAMDADLSGPRWGCWRWFLHNAASTQRATLSGDAANNDNKHHVVLQCFSSDEYLAHLGIINQSVTETWHKLPGWEEEQAENVAQSLQQRTGMPVREGSHLT